MNNVTRSFVGRQTVNPKTTLGFYGSVIVAIIAGCATLSGVLATTPAAFLVMPLLIGSGAFLFLIVGAVIFINITRPQNLMLGQITGSEYRAIETAYMGDSRRGERPVLLENGTPREEPQQMAGIQAVEERDQRAITSSQQYHPLPGDEARGNE